MPRLTFPTLNLLLSLVECGHSCPIQVAHAVWFGVDGDVVGHFYLPSHKGADPRLQFSAVWPPSHKGARERGEDALTLRRSHRRRVFETLAQQQTSPTSMETSSTRGSSPSRNQSSHVLGERKSLDIVAVLVLPPSSASQASVDYLDVTRLQQYCELPPPAEGESQESILIAFPSTVFDGVRLTTLYLSASSDGHQSRCVVAEMRQSSAPLSSQAVPMVDRTTTAVNLPLPRGLQHRVEPLVTSLASSFSPEVWRSHRDRLSVMCMVIYRGSPKYVEQLWFLCALDAPSSDAQTGETATKSNGVDASANVTEEISWSFHSVGRSRKAEEDKAHSPHRWTFTSEPKRRKTDAPAAEKRIGSTSPSVPSRGSAGAATGGAGTPCQNTTFTRQVSSHSRSLVAVPGEFLLENSGRYVDDAAAATHTDGGHERGCWQRYDRQNYDVADSSSFSSRRSLRTVQGAPNPLGGAQVPEPSSTWVLEQKDYVERLCDGSIGGYLVEPLVPIGRDRQAVSRLEALRRGGTRADAVTAVSATAALDDDDDTDGGGGADVAHHNRAPPANHPGRTTAQASCLSAELLTRLTLKEERERVPVHTADPFVRVRNGLLKPNPRRRGLKKQVHESPGGPGVSAQLLSVMHRSNFMDRFLDEASREMPEVVEGSDVGSTQNASLSSSQTQRRLQPVALAVQLAMQQQAQSPLLRSTPLPTTGTPPLPSVGGAPRSTFAAAEALTPRAWLLEELCVSECRQRSEDACYEIYSIHGSQPMEQLAVSKAPHLRLIPHPSICLPFGDPMTAQSALELVYWLSPFRHWKHLQVRCHKKVVVRASEDSNERGSTNCATPSEGQPSIQSCRFVVSAEFPNALPAVKLDFSALAAQLDAVEAYVATRATEQELRLIVAQRKAMAVGRQEFFQQVADTFDTGKDVTQQFLDAVSKRQLANAHLVVERMGK